MLLQTILWTNNFPCTFPAAFGTDHQGYMLSNMRHEIGETERNRLMDQSHQPLKGFPSPPRVLQVGVARSPDWISEKIAPRSADTLAESALRAATLAISNLVGLFDSVGEGGGGILNVALSSVTTSSPRNSTLPSRPDNHISARFSEEPIFWGGRSTYRHQSVLHAS